MLPDDPSHLVTVHLDDGVAHLDFVEGSSLRFFSLALVPSSSKAAKREQEIAYVLLQR